MQRTTKKKYKKKVRESKGEIEKERMNFSLFIQILSTGTLSKTTTLLGQRDRETESDQLTDDRERETKRENSPFVLYSNLVDGNIVEKQRLCPGS